MRMIPAITAAVAALAATVALVTVGVPAHAAGADTLPEPNITHAQERADATAQRADRALKALADAQALFRTHPARGARRQVESDVGDATLVLRVRS